MKVCEPYWQAGGSTQDAQEEGCVCPWLERGQDHTKDEKDAQAEKVDEHPEEDWSGQM